MHRHRRAEHAEHDIRPPLDVHKCRRHEVAQREIEDPVRARAQRDRLPPDSQRIQLRRVDPADGPPRRREARDKKIRAGDDGLRRGARDLPTLLGRAVRVFGRRRAVRRHQAGVGVHPGGHEEGADEEGPAAAPAVDEEEGWDGHDYVYYVLNGGGDEVGVAAEAGHAEDVDDWDGG